MRSATDRLTRAARRRTAEQTRRGGVLVLAAALLVALFAFAAFVVDVGYITLTRAELSKTADGSALAAANELVDAYGTGALVTQAGGAANGRLAAQQVAHANEAGGLQSTVIDTARDVRFGRYLWDGDAGEWTKVWDQQPYNLAEVSLRRDVINDGVPSSSGDGPLDLFFAPVIGSKRAGTSITSTAALLPAVGFKIEANSGLNIGILPIALDVETWTNLIDHNIGDDEFTFNTQTGAVTAGGDGIREVSLYPTGSNLLPPGNRGTVDIGPMNNSTADISRQILYGINQSDLDSLKAQGVELRWDNGPIVLNGDTGLSAGIKDELEAIKGQPRAIPIFSQVSGPGNNAMYTIVKFVGVRIMFVQLTGKPTSKRVVIQPAPMTDPSFVTGTAEIRADTMFGPASLVP
ncbi:MAG: hypothetical protein KF774_10965 [Planctomyces sp.]|nr:hypothetical protein [Planctomyces sp.]